MQTVVWPAASLLAPCPLPGNVSRSNPEVYNAQGKMQHDNNGYNQLKFPFKFQCEVSLPR